MTTAANIRLGAGTAPTVPAGEGALYFDQSDDQLYVIDAAGNTVGPVGGGGSVPTLQDVYDSGRIVDVVPVSGAITLQNTVAGNKVTPLEISNVSTLGAPGIEIAMLGSANGPGIAVGLLASSSGPGVSISASGSGDGAYISAAGAGDGVTVDHNGGNAGIVVNGASGTSLVNGEYVQTPRVVLADGGTSRVEIIGDPGAGSHYNPQVRVTSGSVNIGAVARCSASLVNAGGAAVDLTLDTSYPTFIELVPGGAGVIVTLPSSADYPRGTQLTLINVDGANSISLASPIGPTVSSIISPVGGVVPAVTVPANTGIQLVARLFGWTVTGTF
jgi:hypothetical protein